MSLFQEGCRSDRTAMPETIVHSVNGGNRAYRSRFSSIQMCPVVLTIVSIARRAEMQSKPDRFHRVSRFSPETRVLGEGRRSVRPTTSLLKLATSRRENDRALGGTRIGGHPNRESHGHLAAR